MAESMQGLKRTHRCAELSAANVGEKVTLMGWVQKNRNKGGLVFVDVRDRSGIIQVVCEEGKTDADGGYDFAADASVFHGIGLFIQGFQFLLEFVRHFTVCRSLCSGGGSLFF